MRRVTAAALAVVAAIVMASAESAQVLRVGSYKGAPDSSARSKRPSMPRSPATLVAPLGDGFDPGDDVDIAGIAFDLDSEPRV